MDVHPITRCSAFARVLADMELALPFGSFTVQTVVKQLRQGKSAAVVLLCSSYLPSVQRRALLLVNWWPIKRLSARN